LLRRCEFAALRPCVHMRLVHGCALKKNWA